MMRRAFVIIIVITMLLSTSYAATSIPQKDVVLSTGPVHNIDTDEYFNEIQTAINDPDTLDGHTIEVVSGTYYEKVSIDKSITLIGDGRETTIIDGEGVGDTLILEKNDISVYNVTIKNGTRAIYCNNINNIIFSNINATGGIGFSGIPAIELMDVINFTLINSYIIGGSGYDWRGTGAPAIVTVNSTGMLIGSSLIGGNGGTGASSSPFAGFGGGDGLYSSGSTFEILDSNISGGNAWDWRGRGGNGIHTGENNYWSAELDFSTSSLFRTFNLSSVSSATLFFQYRYNVFGTDPVGDYLSVSVSTNGGNNYTELMNYTMFELPMEHWRHEIIDITPYVGDDIILNFTIHAEMGFPFWEIDNIHIPDIGFYDECENGTNDWLVWTNGFIMPWNHEWTILSDENEQMYPSEITIVDSVISGGSGGGGGNGISFAYSVFSILNSTVMGGSTWDGRIYGKANGMILYSENNINLNHSTFIAGTGGSGIYSISRSSYLSIYDCAFSDSVNGLYSYFSIISITGSSVNNNVYGLYAIYLKSSIIENNNITKNGNGISLFYSNNNTIYHNSFIDNTIQAYDNGTSSWDDGYPSGGNYWSDYVGVDNFHGPNQDIPGSDGIGDTNYTNIAGGAGAVDEYPLMSPFEYTEYDIPLQQGWNLISLPVRQLDWSIDSVLESIAGKWDCIQAYDETTSTWKSNNIFRPASVNDLNELNHLEAYWINIIEPGVTLTVKGDKFNSTLSLPLKAGWNLVGYPSLVENTIADALIGTGYDRPVEGFNASAPYRISPLADTYMMRPGEGYWVHVPADSVWVVDW